MTNTDTATALLRDEHSLILEVTEVLEKVLDKGQVAETFDFDSIGECVTFLQLFADACHHKKEEDLLFPALQAKGMPHDQGPIAVMLDDHRRGRIFVQQMADALENSRSGNQEAMQAVHAGGRGFIDLIRGHIFKENHILFNMADGMLAGAPCRELCNSYEEVCRRRFEGKTREELQALAARLMDRYPSPA